MTEAARRASLLRLDVVPHVPQLPEVTILRIFVSSGSAPQDLGKLEPAVENSHFTFVCVGKRKKLHP